LTNKYELYVIEVIPFNFCLSEVCNSKKNENGNTGVCSSLAVVNMRMIFVPRRKKNMKMVAETSCGKLESSKQRKQHMIGQTAQ
jgi:hypothetical protein